MAGDPNYTKMVLGLHFYGANNGTTFTDVSVSNRTATVFGNTKTITTQTDPFGASNGVGYFDGSGDYLEYADSADWDLTGDFLIRFRVMLDAYSASYAGLYGVCVIAAYSADAVITPDSGWQVRINGTVSSYTTINVYTGLTDLNFTITGGLALSTWHDIEVSRVSGNIRAFANGTQAGTTTANSDSFTRSNTNTTKIGWLDNPTYGFYLNGKLADLQVYKGVGGHTADFTPNPSPFLGFLGVDGLSITSANGLAAYLLSPALSGSTTSMATGQPATDAAITPNGQVITSQQGSIPEALNGLFLALTGQSFTSASGTPIYDLSTTLAGFQAAVNQGALTAFIEMFVALTGIESSSIEGAIAALVSKALSGATAALSEGIFIPSKGFALSGKQLSLSKGTPRHSVQIGTTGYELAFSGGQIIYSVPLSSHLLTATKGAIKAVNDNTLSGSAIQVDAGATIAALSKMAVGQSITVERGDTVATFTKSLANNLIIMAGKGEIVFDSRDVTVAMVGKTITTSEGTIYIGADKWYNFTRVLAGGTDVTIVHLA